MKEINEFYTERLQIVSFAVDNPIYCDMQVQVQEKFYYYHCFEFVFKLILIRGSCTKCYEIPSKLLMQNRKKY